MVRLQLFQHHIAVFLAFGCHGGLSAVTWSRGEGMGTSPEETSAQVFSTRFEYDQFVQSWMTSNPRLAKDITDEVVDGLWGQFSGVAPSGYQDQWPLNPVLKSRRGYPMETEIEVARVVVAAAIKEQNERNKWLLANPRRSSRNYQNDTLNESFQFYRNYKYDQKVIEAAAIVAEADAKAAASASNLTLRSEADEPYYWLADAATQHKGNSPFGDPNYVVFRNVKSYGAFGDGLHDDSAAINAAIQAGNRCGQGCQGSSVTPALVYFPSGTYLVSSQIQMYYNTQLVGNPNALPVIKASQSYAGLGLITSDVYVNGGSEWYSQTNNFNRQVRNLKIDMTDCTTDQIAALHWQVAQATSLDNLQIAMRPGSSQVGIYMENGSGGWLSDLQISGGNIGLQCGNQQFTSRALTFSNMKYAIMMSWDWGWLWKSLDISNCDYGIYFDDANIGGSIYVLDSIFRNVRQAAIWVRSPDSGSALEQIAVNVENIAVVNTPTAVQHQPSGVTLAGGSRTIRSWSYGKWYSGRSGAGQMLAGVESASARKQAIPVLNGGPQGGYFEKSKPQYPSLQYGQWVSVSPVAKGDGSTDDTAALSLAIATATAAGKVVFIPTGSYILRSTLQIPLGARIVGACWPQLMATGANFQQLAATPAISVGKPGDAGTIEIQDLIFATKGPTPGAVLVQWNARQHSNGDVGMWDSHFRIGGTKGSGLTINDCPKLPAQVNGNCKGPQLLLHLTPSSSGYFENVWVWTADHDWDSPTQAQIDIYVGRGVLIESQGPSWLYGSASEHHILYQYSLAGAKNVFMGIIQTEAAYFHPTPASPTPFDDPLLGTFTDDPDFKNCGSDNTCRVGWGLSITNSANVHVLGAGLYSWYYDHYRQDCIQAQNCQKSVMRSLSNDASVAVLNLMTIGSTYMVDTLGQGTSIRAADNMVMTGNPWLSVIAGWTS